MLLTEEEAKTKWCPMARSLDFSSNRRHPQLIPGKHDGDALTERGQIHEQCKCIASGCMMFDWYVLVNGRRPVWMPSKERAELYAQEHRESDLPNRAEVLGRCGLAGKPEVA